MEIYQVIMVGIIGATLSLILRKTQPSFAAVVGILTSILIIFMVLPFFSATMEMILEMGEKVTFSTPFIPIILKVIGIAYICEFGAQICIDAGETAIAGKIEMAGKILIMGLAAPIVFTLIEEILQLA